MKDSLILVVKEKRTLSGWWVVIFVEALTLFIGEQNGFYNVCLTGKL